jgi:hypothetical protein
MGWIVGFAVLAGIAFAAWWAFKEDPHWVAKDGRAFTCRTQRLGGPHLLPDGRWTEARAFIEGQRLVVRPRGLLTAGKPSARYEIVRRVPDAPDRFAVWMADGGGISGHHFAMVRIPAHSPAVAHLDAIATAEPSA